MLKVISFFKAVPVQKKDYFPETNLLIPVYNGDKIIASKLENCLKLDYPKDKLKITVISDSSTDKTEEIVSRFKEDRFKLLRLDRRGGKTRALNLALKDVQAELIFFTDASTLLKEDSLKKIAENFADESIGCVSGEDSSINTLSDKSLSGEGLYVRVEMKLRRLESKTGSLTGVSGCLYAIRRELIGQIPNDYIDDFYLPLQIIKQDKRVISEPEGTVFVTKVRSFKQEFRRRRRTALGGLEVLFSELSLLNPFRYGFFSLKLVSHKLLRWLAPFSLLFLLLINLLLLGEHIIFKLSFAIELLSVLMALFYWSFLSSKDLKGAFSILESVFYFYLVQVAIISAWVKLTLGKREIVWEPSKR